MRKPKDLTGLKFGRLTVLKLVEVVKGRGSKWECLCDCGNKLSVLRNSLITGNTNSCGCYKADKVREWCFKDLTGQVFGRLTVLRESSVKRGKSIRWVCRCSCGKELEVLGGHLTNGHSKSCGCFRSDTLSLTNRTHHLSTAPIYKVWTRIKSRCYNTNNKDYRHYGRRGIKVCDRWKDSFENFYADMGECPSGLSIDRIDVNGDYTPENCRWETWERQSRNKRNNTLVTVAGVRGTLPDVASVFERNLGTLHSYVSRQDRHDLTEYLKTRCGDTYEEKLQKWINLSEAA